MTIEQCVTCKSMSIGSYTWRISAGFFNITFECNQVQQDLCYTFPGIELGFKPPNKKCEKYGSKETEET